MISIVGKKKKGTFFFVVSENMYIELSPLKESQTNSSAELNSTAHPIVEPIVTDSHNNASKSQLSFGLEKHSSILLSTLDRLTVDWPSDDQFVSGQTFQGPTAHAIIP